MIVKAKAIKEIGRREDWRAVAFSPIGKYNDLKVSEYFTFTCSGSNFPYISIGREYEIEIEEQKMYRGNMTYSIVGCPSLDKLDFNNLSREEAMEIMSDITSSPRIANNVISIYPNFIEIILTEGKEAIDTSKIMGVGEAYLSSYSRQLLEKYKYYHILKQYNMYKLDVNDCKILFERYNNEDKIKEEMKSNPYYILIELLGNTFNYADRLIISYRKDLINSKERCEALIIHILKRNELSGSTRINGNELFYYMKTEYEMGNFASITKQVSEESNLIYYDEKSKDLSLMSSYLGECRIADFVKTKLRNSHKLDIDWTKYKEVNGFNATDEQITLLDNFCNYDFMILSGVSGGGKTTSIQCLIELMENNGINYCLLAPTGSASLRLKNQCHRNASTIHRRVLQGGEIYDDACSLDETSMVNLETFLMFINSIENENCKIILCGDFNQIASVGTSTIFSDLIKCRKVPISNLTKVFRYDTDGGSFVGTNIRLGKSFFDDKKVKKIGNIYDVCGNYKFIQTDEIFENIIKEYAKLIKQGYKRDEIIILSPMNKGDIGTYNINNMIELEYNPPKPNEHTMEYTIDGVNIVFRTNSKVINIKNDYRAMPLESYEILENDIDKILKEDDVPKTQIFNGQLGVVRSIDNKKMVIQFDEELIVFTKEKIRNLLLGNAISVHRSQGGEWKTVINVVSPKHIKMLSKNLLYVADTRAKEKHIDIGDRETFEQALLIDEVLERNTWLYELMLEGEL